METILRVLFVYVFLVFALRVMGKREFSEFSAIELVVILLIPEMLNEALVGNDPSLTNGIVAACTLLLVVFLTSALTFVSKRAESVIESAPSVLAFDGKLVEKNLRRERVTPEELYSEMRMQGYERLDQVKWAILEGDGKISVVPTEAAS